MKGSIIKEACISCKAYTPPQDRQGTLKGRAYQGTPGEARHGMVKTKPGFQGESDGVSVPSGDTRGGQNEMAFEVP